MILDFLILCFKWSHAIIFDSKRNEKNNYFPLNYAFSFPGIFHAYLVVKNDTKNQLKNIQEISGNLEKVLATLVVWNTETVSKGRKKSPESTWVAA